MQRPITFILSKLTNVKASSCGRKWTARCPCHHDKKNSLSISEGYDGRVLIKCFAGCQTEDVMASMGLSMSDLFEEKEHTPSFQSTKKQRQGNTFTDIYDYTDENGNLLYQVCRTKDKQFPQRTPDGNGGWIWGLSGQQTVLYKLPRLLEGIKEGYPIFLLEGEKDVDRLTGAAFHATTAPMGASAWKEHYNKYFQGADLILVPDQDEPGRRHAQFIAFQLQGITKRTRVLYLPGLQEKEDVSDWLNGQGTPNKLLELIEQTKPFSVADIKTDTGFLNNQTQPTPKSLVQNQYRFHQNAPIVETEATPCGLPTFPIEVYPPTLQEIVKAFAKSVHASMDIAAVQALSIVSIALGPNWKIDAEGFERTSRLWTVIVAPPGSAKTPIMNAMMKPIGEREEFLKTLWQREEAQWKELKDNKESTGKEPVQSHVKVTDFNIDSLINALNFSPKGIILAIDEFRQLFGLLEQTHTGGKNHSRGSFLSMWSGESISVVRKTTDDLYIKEPYVIVCGGTQPDTISSLSLSQGDGMIQRFLWCHPSQSKEIRGYGKKLPSCIRKVWDNAIYEAFDTMHGTAEATLDAIAFGDEAIKHYNQQIIEMNEAKLSSFGAMYAKAPDHLHRIIACLHGMDCLFEEKPQQEVGLEVFERAYKLMEYFLAHSKHCITLAMSRKSEEGTFRELRAKDQGLFSALQNIIELKGKQTLSTSDWSKLLNKHTCLKTNNIGLGRALKRLSEIPLPGLSIEQPKTKNSKARLWKIIPTKQ